MKHALLLLCFALTLPVFAVDGLAFLRDLPDNTWAELTPGDTLPPSIGHCNITVDCDSHRVFLFGSDTHGYNNNNSIWYFNLRDFTWHQVYPDDPLTSYRRITSSILDSGRYWPVCSTSTGWHPMPSHTFDGMRYVPKKSAILMLEDWPHNGNVEGTLGAGSSAAAWLFDTKTLRWSLLMNAKAPSPSIIGKIGVIPDGSLAMAAVSGTWHFDWTDSTWKNVNATGSGPATYHNAVEYDTHHGRFVVYGGSGGFDRNAYDPVSHVWTLMDSSAIGPVMNGTNIGYDTLNRVVVAMAVEDPATAFGNPGGLSQTWVRSSLDNKWRMTKRKVLGDSLPPHYGFSFRCDYDLANNVTFYMTGNRIWAYRFKTAATLAREKAMTGLELLSDNSDIELYLSTRLRYVMTGPSAARDTTDNFILCEPVALDPLVAVTDARGYVTARGTGAARFTMEKNGFRDTVTLTVGGSTAILDSIRISPSTLARLKSDPCSLSATGYFHKGAATFTRVIDTVAAWTSSDEAAVTVSRGVLTLLAAGGPVSITASLDGISSSALVTVWPKPAYIARINFGPSATPWKAGWLADNGGAYSSAAGRGWTSGAGASRDDRNGSNYLLKSFVQGAPGHYRLDLADGVYITKIGMGDNVYGTNSYNWTAVGPDTIARKSIGRGNELTVDTLTVSGGFADLTINSSINYLVVISNEGIDINQVADDGDTTYHPTACEHPALGLFSDAMLSISPVPCNPVVNIRVSGMPGALFKIYDATGRLVTTLSPDLNGRAIWRAQSRASGIYTVRAVNTKTSLTRRIVLTR